MTTQTQSRMSTIADVDRATRVDGWVTPGGPNEARLDEVRRTCGPHVLLDRGVAPLRKIRTRR
jgi:hypothetical protein